MIDGKPLLCRECAKTRNYGLYRMDAPDMGPPAEQGIPRRDNTIGHVVDGQVRFYTRDAGDFQGLDD